MADGIRATPYSSSFAGTANDLIGGLLGYMRDPRRTQQMQGLAGLLEGTGIPKTVERLAYGEPLTNIRQANVPTLRPETANALLTLLPVPSGASKAAKAIDPAVQKYGPRLEQSLLPAFEAAYNRGGLTREMVEAMGTGVQSPLTVYHGSPAKFNKFDRTKIGSGEGAQAYGYGHYVAESPDVARRYQMGLTQAKGEEVLYKNKPLTDLYSQIENKSMKMSGKAADIENQKLQLVEHMMLDKPPQELIPYAKETGFDQSVIDWLERDVVKNTQIPGAFYEIDLPDSQISRMLDYDKPLSQQSKEVQKAYQSYLQTPQAGELAKQWTRYKDGMTLDQAEPLLSVKNDPSMSNILKNAFRSPQEASDFFRQSGIPGVRYLDEGSRGVGEGTSNFVVFPGNEDLLTILKRNGGLLD